jgi:hypothetical protein
MRTEFGCYTLCNYHRLVISYQSSSPFSNAVLLLKSPFSPKSQSLPDPLSPFLSSMSYITTHLSNPHPLSFFNSPSPTFPLLTRLLSPSKSTILFTLPNGPSSSSTSAFLRSNSSRPGVLKTECLLAAVAWDSAVMFDVAEMETRSVGEMRGPGVRGVNGVRGDMGGREGCVGWDARGW